jgi:hypothetical protein
VQTLGSSEQFFVALRRFTATNLVRVIAIEGKLAPDTIRLVLPALQARHPRLNVHVEDSDRPRFVREQGAPIPLHVIRRRDGEHWCRLLEQLLNVPLPQQPGPLLHVYYLHAPDQVRAELFVVCDHVIGDGISINALCAELLGLCAGDTIQPARPTLPVLDELSPQFSHCRRAAAFSRALVRFTRSALLRRRHEKLTGGKFTRFMSTILTVEQTQTLLARARAEQTTLTGALMEAVSLAVREVRVTAPRLALSVPVNMRPHIPVHRLEAEDLGIFTNVAYLDADDGDDFWSRARAWKTQLSEVAGSTRLLAALPLIYWMGRLSVRSGRPPFAHALISNSGIVPLRTSYGAFRPVDFFSANSAVMLSADFAFFCNTFDRRLRINLVFLQEVVEGATARRVLDAVGARLTRQLGKRELLSTAADSSAPAPA